MKRGVVMTEAEMAADLIALAAGASRRVIDHAACSMLVAGTGVAVKLTKV